MICPACKSKQNRVTDTREHPSGRIYRRRMCHRCKMRWTTWEVNAVDEESATLVSIDWLHPEDKEKNGPWCWLLGFMEDWLALRRASDPDKRGRLERSGPTFYVHKADIRRVTLLEEKAYA